MSVRTRLLTGVSAYALGPFITALVQIVSVPAFLRGWGPHLYGEWLILAAVPTYLSMTDMGFGSVAGNDMAMRVACSDRDGALETFQSIWLLVTALSALVGVIIFSIIFLAPVQEWLRITSLTPSETRLTLVFLSLFSLASLQSSILMSGFRSDGQYAFGAAAVNMMRILEDSAMLIPLILAHARPIHVAMAGALVRTAATGFLYMLLTRRLPWIRVGVARASRERIKALTRPALAFMAFPAGNAISLQGMTILIGLGLGPVAVATFNPMRTLSRLPYQVIEAIKNAAWPELSAAYGAANWQLARKLHRSCFQAAFWLSLLAVVSLATLGPTIFGIWTHQRLAMDFPVFSILLMVTVASSMWTTSSAVSIAANLHERVATRYLIGTSASLALGHVLMPHLQMAGAALALLASDIWMGCFVVPYSNNLLKDDTADFLRCMFALKKLKPITAE